MGQLSLVSADFEQLNHLLPQSARPISKLL